MRSTTAYNLLPGSVYLRNMTDGSVGVSQYIASSVNQTALKTTTGEGSTTGTAIYALPGGSYGFFIRIRNSGAGTASIEDESEQTDPSSDTIYSTVSTTFTMGLSIQATAGTTYLEQRYIQASPPYNLGPLFIYVIIDKNGNIETVSIAPDPPWANNGPTNIRPDYYSAGKGYKKIKKAKKSGDKLILPIEYEVSEQEITMDYKDSDMNLIPHPFQGNDLTDKTIAIIEPGSDLCCELFELHETGESISELFHEGYFTIDNQPLTMKAPMECMPVSAKWKLTK